VELNTSRLSRTLVLSTEAGAFEELHAACLPLHPFDVTATAHALHRALDEDASSRAERSGRLAALARARTPDAWLADQFAAAAVSSGVSSPR